jgi:hypothetical protein
VGGKRETQTETNRQADTQDRWTYKQKGRHTNRQAHIEQTGRQTIINRQRDRHTDRETKTALQISCRKEKERNRLTKKGKEKEDKR